MVETGGLNPSDSIACLTGTWGSNQMAQATLFTSDTSGGGHEEMELLLRWDIAANNARGYEINFSVLGQYCQVVRWNGPHASYLQLNNDSTQFPPFTLTNGTLCAAKVVGNTISVYCGGILAYSLTDNVWSNGTPGLGFYVDGRSVGDGTHFGWTNYWATDDWTNTFFSDGTVSNVQSLLNSATNGQVVTVPSGNFNWTNHLLVTNGVTLAGMGAGGYVGHSDSSVAVGTGSKTFAISATNYLNFTNGQPVMAMFENTYYQTNSMIGTVTSWNGSSLVMNSTTATGAGTFGMWAISIPPLTCITNWDVTDGLVQITPGSVSKPSQLQGCYVTYAPLSSTVLDHVLINPGAGIALVHDCWFSRPGNTSGRSVYFQDNKGICYRCSFDTGFLCNELNGTGNLDEALVFKNVGLTGSWSANSTMGQLDTGGTNNAYVEQCYLAGMFLQGIDPDDNSRVVLRNLTMDNSGLTSHGSDTSAWGVRHVELYNSQFIFNNADTNTLNVAWWYESRGATGVCFSNNMPNITSGQWGDKSVNSTIVIVESPYRSQGPYACVQTWPSGHQVGQGVTNGVQGLEPMYYWGNTGSGNIPAIASYSCSAGNNCTNCATAPAAGFFIQYGRDVFTNAIKPGYAALVFPHPLRADQSGVFDPSISSQPTDQTVTAPATATFSVTASGQTALSYQWNRAGTNVTGATSSSYTTPPTATGDNGQAVYVTVTDTAGSLQSASATLYVNSSGGGTTNNGSVSAGAGVSFGVGVKTL